jgi:hypothetical protein
MPGGKFTDSLITENLKVATEYFKATIAKVQNDAFGEIKNSGGSIGFIPFKINFTMDGLSGIKIYNELVLDTSFLPQGYSKTLKFIVTGVDHKLSKNDWETTISTTLIPTTSNVSKITGSLKISLKEEDTPEIETPAGTPVSTILKPLVGGDNVEKALRFFIDQKAYPKWKAAGIVAAIMGESGGQLNPLAVNPTSNAFGIAQWLGNRRTNLKTVAGAKDNTLEGQLAFLYAELQPGSGYTDTIADNFIAQATNADEMLAAMATFERWGYPVDLFYANGESYQKVYNIMKNEAATKTSPDGSFKSRIAYLIQVKDLIKKLYGSYQ